jgi:hypothetical protein
VPARYREAEMATFPKVVDVAELERKVNDIYTRGALDSESGCHFEMGRTMALRLGYADAELAAVPPEAIQSFAGDGYYFEADGRSRRFAVGGCGLFPRRSRLRVRERGATRSRQVFHDGGIIPMSVDSGGRS